MQEAENGPQVVGKQKEDIWSGKQKFKQPNDDLYFFSTCYLL